MKRFLKITCLILITLAIAMVVILYPIFSNMRSEYGTGQAVRDITSYVRKNEGKWPSSPEELENKYPVGGKVVIDYSVTADELIADPDKLQEAVRPKSGKFYTYPHYNQHLDDLLRTLKQVRERVQLAESSLFQYRTRQMSGGFQTGARTEDSTSSWEDFLDGSSGLFHGGSIKLDDVIRNEADHLQAISSIPKKLLSKHRLSKTAEYDGWYYSSFELTSLELTSPSWFQVIGSKIGDDHLHFSYSW